MLVSVQEHSFFLEDHVGGQSSTSSADETVDDLTTEVSEVLLQRAKAILAGRELSYVTTERQAGLEVHGSAEYVTVLFSFAGKSLHPIQTTLGINNLLAGLKYPTATSGHTPCEVGRHGSTTGHKSASDESTNLKPNLSCHVWILSNHVAKVLGKGHDLLSTAQPFTGCHGAFHVASFEELHRQRFNGVTKVGYAFEVLFSNAVAIQHDCCFGVGTTDRVKEVFVSIGDHVPVFVSKLLSLHECSKLIKLSLSISCYVLERIQDASEATPHLYPARVAKLFTRLVVEVVEDDRALEHVH